MDVAVDKALDESLPLQNPSSFCSLFNMEHNSCN
jgi:hypothetical protein